MPAFQRQWIAAALALTLLTREIPAAADEDAVTRGEYLVRAGGCFSCHTAAGGQQLAGGRALATPFGTFYSPNITPDDATGIGKWTLDDFHRALRDGRVIDFIRVHYYDASYPIFNVADSAISVGVALIIISSLFGKKESV